MAADTAIYFYSRIENGYKGLSNFAYSSIRIDGAVYRTVEHYYQQAKCTNEPDRAYILAAHTPGEAKQRGRAVRVRSDWNDDPVRLDVMRHALRANFTQHPGLRDLLLSTDDRELREDGPDRFWGWVGGRGKNWLGLLLMELRGELRRESA